MIRFILWVQLPRCAYLYRSTHCRPLASVGSAEWRKPRKLSDISEDLSDVAGRSSFPIETIACSDTLPIILEWNKSCLSTSCQSASSSMSPVVLPPSFMSSATFSAPQASTLSSPCTWPAGLLAELAGTWKDLSFTSTWSAEDDTASSAPLMSASEQERRFQRNADSEDVSGPSKSKSPLLQLSNSFDLCPLLRSLFRSTFSDPVSNSWSKSQNRNPIRHKCPNSYLHMALTKRSADTQIIHLSKAFKENNHDHVFWILSTPKFSF